MTAALRMELTCISTTRGCIHRRKTISQHARGRGYVRLRVSEGGGEDRKRRGGRKVAEEEDVAAAAARRWEVAMGKERTGAKLLGVDSGEQGRG